MLKSINLQLLVRPVLKADESESQTQSKSNIETFAGGFCNSRTSKGNV